LVDNGFQPEPLTSADDMAALAGIRAHDIVRLEALAEGVVQAGTTATTFAAACADALDRQVTTGGVVGCKSIAAYRVGLRLPGPAPTGAEVRTAADRWLSEVDRTGRLRLADPILHRFLIELAVERRLPTQIHVGYGDADLNLAECDPLLLTELLRATRSTGVPIMLLHNYPFHRNAGYLAQVFPHVFVDVGLATHNVGFRADALIAETLEVTPFGKFLFSTDAFGLAEHYHLGTVLFRRALSAFLRDGIAATDWTTADADRICALIGHQNARRAYRLDELAG
jgi:predicted TIM-barrel fold metal-dependent hydrolase